MTMTMTAPRRLDAPVPAPAPGALVDGFGRVHRDMRVSVTDRCSLRCTYCMSAEGVPLMPARDLLTDAEIVRAVAVATRLGVDRVRLTGGEPLVRPGLVGIVAGIVGLPSAPEVSLTTNGIGLAELAEPLAQAGLSRVNISIDSLDPVHYATLARRDRLAQALAGVAAARDAGLTPVKINTVVMPGINEDDVLPLVDFALAGGFELRFIEQMPLDSGHLWRRDLMITAPDILDLIRTKHRLTQLDDTDAPAQRWLVDDGPGAVGVIAAVTRPFCARCDRVRLTADGQLRNCLFSNAESDLRSAMRSGASDDQLAQIFRACVSAKRAQHGIGQPGFVPPARPMSAIGG